MIKVDLKIVKRQEKYPDFIINQLSVLTASLWSCRRIYLGTTLIGEHQIPMLILEVIDEEAGQDIEKSSVAMSHIFDDDYEVKAIPAGSWWINIQAIAQKVRDLHS